MRWLRVIKARFTGLTNAITRFPLTTLFLLGAAGTTAYMIIAEKDNPKYLLTFIVGAFISAVLQIVYERFFTKSVHSLVLFGLSILLTAGYFLTIMSDPTLNNQAIIRTIIALFTLFIAFIWVPVINSYISFNTSFMVTFKAAFSSLFFSGILYGGICIIIAAFNQLIFSIDYRAYPHTANIIFSLFAPIYFLSLIPKYPGGETHVHPKEEHCKLREQIDKASIVPKFLQVLISYIVIPLVAVFTFILVLYILKNIRGDFWTDNLLEPMLIFYSITVLLVYFLASEIENKFTSFFRKVFPKVLVPIVLFQIISSFLTLSDTGITHTRYFVILFGIYAAIAGLLMSFLPIRKNGIIAAILIVFGAISIIPPVDAFTISRNNQISRLQEVLEKNDMLENNKIIPKGSITDQDKKTITDSVNYLDMMEYTKNIEWLPSQFNSFDDFQKTFGFSQYQNALDGEIVQQLLFLSLDRSAPITIKGFDTFIQTDYSTYDRQRDQNICQIQKDGKTYQLIKDFTDDGQFLFKLVGGNGQELISFHTKKIKDKFSTYTSGKELLTLEEATFGEENDLAKLMIVVQDANFEKTTNNKQQQDAQLYIFVQIK